MSRFLVFGSIGWDRPIWLDQPLSSGARLLGFSGSDHTSNLPEGRLGGAASNGAACLVNAGHQVAVWSALRTDEVGQDIKNRLIDLGIDVSFLHAMEPVGGETMILIEPDGERTILFQHGDPNLDRTLRRVLKQQTARIDLSKIQSFNPDGMILRSLFHGFEQLAHLHQVSTVAHWPQGAQTSIIPADVLIGSRDDLVTAQLLDHPFAHAAKACGGRLKGLIITNGKSGGEVITEQRRIAFVSPSVKQVDATGAGDAFAAGVLDALIAGADLVEAAQHGATWGSTSAGLIGSAEPRAEDTFRSWHRTTVPAD